MLTDLLTGASSIRAGLVGLVDDLVSGQQSAEDQVGEGVSYLTVGLQVGLYVLLHRERNICSKSSQARCSIRCVLTTVLGSRPGGSALRSFVVACRTRVLGSIGLSRIGSSSACLW